MRDPITLVVWCVACGICGMNSTNLGLGLLNVLMFYAAAALASTEGSTP